ncbi:hypothetical protein DFJ73DRAFT_185042 [Zopfochytrium polystomum]|nr:hypothetical protein DFJ73DRAFT_185042 [Zopfochytrium polystomum]
MQHQQHQQHPLHHHALHQRSRYQLNRFSPPSPSAAVAPEPLFAIDRSSSSSRVSPSSLSSSLAAAAAASQPLKQQQPQPSLPQTQPLPKQPPAPTAPASPVAPNADRRFQTPSLTIPAPSNSINPLSQQQQSGGITFRRPSLAQYGALSPNDTTSSSYRKAMTLIGSLSRSLGKNGGASLAMSLSRSLGKSWTRDAFLETLVNHLAPTSPMIAPSPGRDLAQFAVLEDQFCKDFACCGFNLETLHDLLQHFEECHVRLESDFEYGDDEDGGGGDGDHLDDFDDDDDADLPFEFDDGPDDEDMDMDCADQIPAFAQQQRHQFTTAELAASLQNAASAAAAAHTAEMPIANVSNNVNHFGRHTTMLQRSNSSPTRRATPASLLNVSAAPSNSNNAAPLSAFDTSVIRKRTLERHNSSPETSRSSLVGLNTAVPDKRRRQPHPLRSHIDAAPAPTIPFSVETKPDPMRDHDMDMDEDWLEQLVRCPLFPMERGLLNLFLNCRTFVTFYSLDRPRSN